MEVGFIAKNSPINSPVLDLMLLLIRTANLVNSHLLKSKLAFIEKENSRHKIYLCFRNYQKYH